MRTVCRLLRSGARPPRCAQVLSPGSTGALPERIGPLRESNRGIRTWWPPRNRHIGTAKATKAQIWAFRGVDGTELTIGSVQQVRRPAVGASFVRGISNGRVPDDFAMHQPWSPRPPSASLHQLSSTLRRTVLIGRDADHGCTAPSGYGSPMRVEAAIVSYNPARSLLRLVKDLVAAEIPVEVIDNASTSGADVLVECAAAGATLTLLSTNTGVAGALSHALESATAEWLLTFDQDSRLTAHMLEQLLGSNAPNDERVAIVAPVVRDETTARPLQGDPGRKDWYGTERAITSGSLCRVDTLWGVGGFRTDLVIDFVDWDLCLRLRKAGWRIAIEPTAVLEHSIGRATTHRVPLVGEVTTSNHLADRQYYKYRNYFLLARSGQLVHDPKWSARTAVGLGLGIGKVLAFESDKRAKLAAIAASVRDGVVGRSGTRR